jgi:hypothetical protein
MRCQGKSFEVTVFELVCESFVSHCCLENGGFALKNIKIIGALSFVGITFCSAGYSPSDSSTQAVTTAAVLPKCSEIKIEGGGQGNDYWHEFKVSGEPFYVVLAEGDKKHTLKKVYSKWVVSDIFIPTGTSVRVDVGYQTSSGSRIDKSTVPFLLRQANITMNCGGNEGTPTPTLPSKNASYVNFDNHTSGKVYDSKLQDIDWKRRWDLEMSNTSISNSESTSGKNSLKVSYASGKQLNIGANWELAKKNEYYLSYNVKFASDFIFNGPKESGGKLPGLGADDLCSGGKLCDGTNGFSARYMWRKDGKATLYLYHMDKPDTYGQTYDFKLDGKDQYFVKGKWHNLTQRVKMNDGNSYNGEIDVWMDKKQVLSLKGLRFMNVSNGIETLYFSTFHGGNGSDWWPSKTVSAFFDDFIVSTLKSDVGL